MDRFVFEQAGILNDKYIMRKHRPTYRFQLAILEDLVQLAKHLVRDRRPAQQVPRIEAAGPDVRQRLKPVPAVQCLLGGEHDNPHVVISVMSHQLQHQLGHQVQSQLFFAGDTAYFRLHQIDGNRHVGHAFKLQRQPLRLHQERIALQNNRLLRVLDPPRRRHAAYAEAQGQKVRIRRRPFPQPAVELLNALQASGRLRVQLVHRLDLLLAGQRQLAPAVGNELQVFFLPFLFLVFVFADLRRGARERHDQRHHRHGDRQHHEHRLRCERQQARDHQHDGRRRQQRKPGNFRLFIGVRRPRNLQLPARHFRQEPGLAVKQMVFIHHIGLANSL